MKKRIIGILLCICMLASLLAMQVFARESFCTAENPAAVPVTRGEEPEDYFGLWMCDAEHTPNTGGGVSILYELPDGTEPENSGEYWTSSTNQMIHHEKIIRTSFLYGMGSDYFFISTMATRTDDRQTGNERGGKSNGTEDQKLRIQYGHQLRRGQVLGRNDARH